VVIDEQKDEGEDLVQRLGGDVELVRAATPQEAVELLNQGAGDAILADSSAALPISGRSILEAIATGVALVDADLRICWHNQALADLCETTDLVGRNIYEAIGCQEVRGPDFCPFTECLGGAVGRAKTQVRRADNAHVEISVQAIAERGGGGNILLCLVRDITSEVQEREKMTAIHRAGLELGHLTPAELAQMSREERIDLLKANILQHSQNILNFRYVEIRLLDPETRRLNILLSEGMTESANTRELYADRVGNGVTGYVASTGISYICDDVANDPLYLPGAPSARSSITVPMLYRDRVVGTFNVESPEPRNFSESDREFLEIFAREIAVALNTLDLLDVEKQIGGSATIEAVVDGVSLPVDEIVADAIRILDYLLGAVADKEASHEAVRRVLLNARLIKNVIQKVGETVEQERPTRGIEQPTRLTGKRVLVVDADPAVRKSAHVLLSQLGCEVDTARDGREAQKLVRTLEYDVIVGDIRLPDLPGYEFFRAMRECAPQTPIVLMTGFGYDAAHAIVKARQEGLRSVLYKPFRLDRIREAVADALNLSTTPDRRRAAMDLGVTETIL
jgi:CheY-like chemotaxis protein/GAF domain-containing protein